MSESRLLAFSCKKRGFCPSCAARRMAQQAAHLVEQAIPWVPTRQWVVSVPIPLRCRMAPSRELTAQLEAGGGPAIHYTCAASRVCMGLKSVA